MNKTHTPTLVAVLCLCLAQVASLASNPEEIAAEVQAAATVGHDNYDWSSEAAQAVEAALLAKEEISNEELSFLLSALVGPEPARIPRLSEAQLATLRAKGDPTVTARFKAMLDRDTTGWTSEALKLVGPKVASLGTAETPEFNALVIEAFLNSAIPPYKRLFKLYRSTLDLAAQIALTAQAKDALLAVAGRTPQQDAWLAELSADLIALQLDAQ
jgi:hypothetical protein